MFVCVCVSHTPLLSYREDTPLIIHPRSHNLPQKHTRHARSPSNTRCGSTPHNYSLCVCWRGGLWFALTLVQELWAQITALALCAGNFIYSATFSFLSPSGDSRQQNLIRAFSPNAPLTATRSLHSAERMKEIIMTFLVLNHWLCLYLCCGNMICCATNCGTCSLFART